MEGMQAYGAGKAGGAFDPVTFLQQPQTILRIVSWVLLSLPLSLSLRELLLLWRRQVSPAQDNALQHPVTSGVEISTATVAVVFTSPSLISGKSTNILFQPDASSSREVCSELFSIVIFGCIANEGYINRPSEVEEYCIFNRNQNACNYGVFMGSMAFLCCVAFLVLDVYFPQISSVKDRKKAVLADIGISAFWSFMWFVGFCFLANQWQVTKQEDNPLREGGDAARAAITFSFFSIFTWGAQTLFSMEKLKNVSFEEEYTKLFPPQPHQPFAGQSFLAFQRYKLGADSALFSHEYTDPSQDAAGAPYTSFGGDNLESPGGGGGQPNSDGAFDGSGGYQRQDY
ncbi:hypothetical protein CCH79_00015071 [Gambusia affinis]|uniref:MARVEL domain-containing protein n=1 Tax=Gambusia affinis TaxID=33528 RepID=A0A315WBY7_GAMAF|nr:hypothetical protein CCH79_00015071 [Gambusia affinis]